MVMLDFKEPELLEKLEQLAEPLRAAFAAACAQRQQMAYARFFRRTERGNPEALSNILNSLWNDLAGNPLSKKELDRMMAASLELAPNENEGQWVIEQVCAEDAATAVAFALSCRREGSAQDAVWAARRAHASLDQYVHYQENIDTDRPGRRERVLSHPLIQAELARQQRDLNELLARAVTLPELRRRAEHEAATFLPVSAI